MPALPRQFREHIRLSVINTPHDIFWRSAAACSPSDLDLFFVPDGVSVAERSRREAAAKRICAGCSVQRECLGYAIAVDERFGVWGGATAAERRRERTPADTVTSGVGPNPS